MAQTELTAEQKEMWQNAVASVGDFGGAMISAVAKPLDVGLDVTGNALHTLNHNTPSLAGRPMTEILGIDNPKEIVTNALDNFVTGIADAVVNETIGETPDAMIAKFAAHPDMQTEDGQKLIQIMKDDPEFTQAFHTAMINEPTMAPGIAGLMNADGQEGGTSLKTIVDGLADEGNRSKFTQVLTAVGTSANDDLDFNYTMDVADAAHAVSQPGVQQQDYKNLQTLLRKSNIKDPMLDFAADPMAAFEDFKKDPSAFFDQMANSLINFDGPMGDMLRGMIQGMGQYIELLGSPEIMEFYGHYIEPVVNDAMDKFGMNGEAAPVVGTQTPAGPSTPAQQQSVMWKDFKSEIDVSGLAGAENDVTKSLKNSLVTAFEPARMGVEIEDEPEAPAPYAPNPIDLNNVRMNFGGLGL